MRRLYPGRCQCPSHCALIAFFSWISECKYAIYQRRAIKHVNASHLMSEEEQGAVLELAR